MTYNWFLTNTTKTIRKNWNILQVIENLKEIFKYEPIAAFKWNKNIQEVIGNRKWKGQKKKVNAHHAGQNWKCMLQASENCNNIQEPTNKQNLEDISQYKL